LIPRLRRKDDRSWREAIEAGVARWWETMGNGSRCRSRPGQPDAAVPRALGPAATRRHRDGRLRIVGELVRPAAEVPRRRPWLAVGEPGDDGPGRSLRHRREVRQPGRPVIVFAGDGAMQMNGLAELITIKHYGHEWPDPR